MFADRRKNSIGERKKLISSLLKNKTHIFIIIAFLLVGISVFFTAKPLNRNAINNEENTIFNTPWHCVVDGESYGQIELPNSLDVRKGAHIVIKNTLPDHLPKGATVMLRSTQQDAIVFVGEEKVYSSFGIEKSTGAPSSAYHFVRIPDNSENKEVVVLLTSPYKAYSGALNQIYIGSKNSNVFFLVKENGASFIIGFLVFCMGILLMVIFLCAKGYENKLARVYLGAFFVVMGYWVMAESRMLQFIIPYSSAITNTDIFALSSFPVFGGLYYYKSYAKCFRKVGKYTLPIATIASLAFGIIICIKPTVSLSIMPFYAVLMAIFTLSIFVCVVIDFVRDGIKFSLSQYGLTAFIACCLIEILVYIKNATGYRQSKILTIGLLVFCTVMVIDSIQNLTKVYKTAGQIDALSELAYTDSLTGLKNRTAFLERLSDVNTDAQNFISLVMFDVNNLKIINDSYGHLAGDAMLIRSARTIRSCLRQRDAVYRIGGDEFVSIIVHNHPLDSNLLEKRILAALEKENLKKTEYKIIIAYGYATFTQSEDKSLFDTLARADENMYTCKKLQKEKEHQSV